MPVPETSARPESAKSAGSGESPKGTEVASAPSAGPSTRTRGARSANMGSDEWARQRKDNHVRSFVSHFPTAILLTLSPERSRAPTARKHQRRD